MKLKNIIKLLGYFAQGYLLALGVFYGTGCSSVPIKTERTFYPYMIQFANITGVNKTNLKETKIQFRPREGATVGTCNWFHNYILVDPLYWFDQATEPERVALMWHELAHCVCYAGHKEGHFSDGCPRHIMNPILPGDSCMRKHEETYREELRNACAGY